MLLPPLLLLSDAVLLPALLSVEKMKAMYVADNITCEHRSSIEPQVQL